MTPPPTVVAEPPPRRCRVLIVDDNAADLKIAGSIVEKQLQHEALFAANGEEALKIVKQEPPNVILTDLQMPEMDGLELVEEIKTKFPLIPVVVFTAYGSEEIALQVLKAGAASYVPKRMMANDLGGVLEAVLSASEVDQRRHRILQCLIRCEHEFCLMNDPALIPPLVTLLQETLIAMRLCNENGRIRIGVALEEALCNALYHGNLEVSSELRQSGDQPYRALIDRRRMESPYQERVVHVQARMTREEAVFTIRDEGPGFDPSTLPDPTDPANLERASGRGLLLIRTFMDDVSYNSQGNAITMVKRPDKRREKR
jgi:CheY-like chemotaxis protein